MLFAGVDSACFREDGWQLVPEVLVFLTNTDDRVRE